MCRCLGSSSARGAHTRARPHPPRFPSLRPGDTGVPLRTQSEVAGQSHVADASQDLNQGSALVARHLSRSAVLCVMGAGAESALSHRTAGTHRAFVVVMAGPGALPSPAHTGLPGLALTQPSQQVC